jgi:hypothetical protein
MSSQHNTKRELIYLLLRSWGLTSDWSRLSAELWILFIGRTFEIMQSLDSDSWDQCMQHAELRCKSCFMRKFLQHVPAWRAHFVNVTLSKYVSERVGILVHMFDIYVNCSTEGHLTSINIQRHKQPNILIWHDHCDKLKRRLKFYTLRFILYFFYNRSSHRLMWK